MSNRTKPTERCRRLGGSFTY